MCEPNMIRILLQGSGIRDQGSGIRACLAEAPGEWNASEGGGQDYAPLASIHTSCSLPRAACVDNTTMIQITATADAVASANLTVRPAVTGAIGETAPSTGTLVNSRRASMLWNVESNCSAISAAPAATMNARMMPMIIRRFRFGATGDDGGSAGSRILKRSPWLSVSMLDASWASSNRLSSE